MHFPSILYLLDQERRDGAEVVVVPSDDGIGVDTQRIVDAIDERTAVVCLSHVLFKSAYIQDVAPITEKSRQVGAISDHRRLPGGRCDTGRCPGARRSTSTSAAV